MRKIWPWVLPCLALFGLFMMVFLRRLDPDFGWHLQSGRYILAHGIPVHDIFTYTAANFPWINHEWLSDVITASAFWLGGFALVAGIFAAAWTAAVMIAVRRRQWPVLALGFSAVMTQALARPNAWTALLFVVLLWMLERGKRWPVVALFVLWANLHGGFVIGLVAIAWAALKDRRYWWVLVAATLVTFVNPYGPGLYVEIWRTLIDSDLRHNVGEWGPLSIDALNGFYIVVYLFVLLGTNWKQRKFAQPTALLASAVGSMRQYPLFVLASLWLVGEGYEKLVEFLNIRRGWRLYAVMVVATGLAVLPAVKMALYPHNNLPYREVADLRAAPCVGRVFNEYDFGGFIVWQLPGTKTYIDGRMPSWKLGNMDYFATWRGILAHADVADREFKRYDIGCAMLERRHSRLVKQLTDAGWRVTSEDDLALVLRRPVTVAISGR